MLSHEEIRTIVSALGAGIGADDFNLEKRRYGKVIIMTDADIDGAHIRTLLLTFFFRQMKELIRNDCLFVAQPPLYEISQKKQKLYVVNESEMRQRLTTNGLKGAKLRIRMDGGNDVIVEGANLQKLIDVLLDVEEQIRILRRRGIDLQTFTAQDRGGKDGLPAYYLNVDQQEEFFHSEEEYTRRCAELAAQNGDENNGNGNGSNRVVSQELHEVHRLNELRMKLEEYQISPRDYFRREEQTVAGEHVATKFALIDSDQKEIDVPNPQQIIKGIRDIGSRGIAIKRFKGLGEMNADELWTTTMDPERRTLLRIKMEDAAEADRLFSILMGDNVEQRRRFIEQHALEVKNLDI